MGLPIGLMYSDPSPQAARRYRDAEAAVTAASIEIGDAREAIERETSARVKAEKKLMRVDFRKANPLTPGEAAKLRAFVEAAAKDWGTDRFNAILELLA